MKIFKVSKLVSLALVLIFLLWIYFLSNLLSAGNSKKVSSLFSVVAHEQHYKKPSFGFFDFFTNQESESTISDSRVYRFEESDANDKQSILKKLSEYTTDDWEIEILRLANENRELDRKFVIVSAANYGHRDLALNWIASMHRNGYFKFLLFCLDEKLYKTLAELSLSQNLVLVPSKWLQHAVNTTELLWATPSYNILTQAKVRIVHKLLQKNYTVFSTDIDVIWLSPHILSYIDYTFGRREIAYMIDSMDEVNGGFFIAMPTVKVCEFFQEVIRRFNTETALADQYVMNVVLDEWNLKYSSYVYHLCKFLFPNGLVYYHHKMNKKLNIIPMVVHANFFVGLGSKINAIKSSGMWYISRTSSERLFKDQ